MNFKPIPVFTSLAVAAAAALGYVVLNKDVPAPPVQVVEVKPVEPAKTEAPKIELAAPAETPAPATPAAASTESKVAYAEPEVKPAEEPAPSVTAPKMESAKAETPKIVAPAKSEAKSEAKTEATIDADAPSFDTVRVEPDGSAVIAGRAKPGAEVTAKLNGEAIGKATANAEGSFVVVPDQPLPAGAGAISLESENGTTKLASADSVAVVVKEQAKGQALVAVVKPDEPTKIVQAPSAEASQPSNEVKLDAVDYNDKGDIVFSGRAAPENTVRLYVDNAPTGEAKADATGKWSFAGTSTVPAGQHVLRADAVDADGKVSSRVELPFLREEAAKVAAAEPVVATPDAPAAIAAKKPLGPDRVVIQPGNNLWKLSRVIYGKGINYTIIYEANKDQIRNPNKIYPGQIFAAPASVQ
jgi:nucleoid-associated protein YgaU